MQHSPQEGQKGSKMAFRQCSWGATQDISQQASSILECAEPIVSVGNDHFN